MNREIAELREVVTKLVPMLVGKGLKVTQRGSRAYVEADPKTNKPVLVNIPSIPDTATVDFIDAISGFIDHEVGHVLFTDWKYYGGDGVRVDKFSAEGRALTHSHNIFEDTFIEREIVKVFPGSRHNLEILHDHFLKKITTPALQSVKGDPKKEFAVLFVPFVRALSGQQIFQDFMDDGKHWDHPMIRDIHLALSNETMELVKKAASTQDTLKCAQDLHDLMFNRPEPEPEQPEPEPEQPEQQQQPEPEQEAGDDQQQQQQQQEPETGDGESQDKPEKKAGEGDGDGERDHSDQEPGEEGEAEEGEAEEGEAGEGEDGDSEGEAGQSASAGKNGENDNEKESDEGQGQGAQNGASEEDADEDGEEASGAGVAEEDEDAEEGDGEGQSEEEGDGDGEGQEGEEEGEGEEGEGDEGEGNDGEDPDEAEGHPGGDFSSEGEAADGNSKSNAQKGAGGQAGRSMFDLEPEEFAPVDLSSAISKTISDLALKEISKAPYTAFTKDEDKIETFEVDKMQGVKDEWVPQMEEECRSMVGRMQKDIERMMASQAHVIRTPGHRRGKLHSPSLYRVLQDDARVFSQKEEVRSKNTAVSLLIDNSGSMRGHEIKIAMTAGYALASTLERVSVANEVVGFTTAQLSSNARNALRNDAGSFNRDCAIVMPVFKGFEERVTPIVKKRIAAQINLQVGMNTNVDGESLQYAAQRLLKRPEKRKVMLVMSDGQPVGSGTAAHLRDTVQDLEKMGIETVGIGILTDVVKQFYPRWMELNDTNDLPGVVMGELRRILTK